MRKIIVCVAIATSLVACTTARKAVTYFNEHPDVSAGYCAEKYPVKDSVGETTTVYTPANNEDLQPKLDELQQTAEGLQRKLVEADSARRKDPAKPCPEVRPFQNEIDALLTRISKLQSEYKPCIPDTIFKEKVVYRENTAMVASLSEQIKKITRALENMTGERDIYKEEASRRLKWILALFALVGLGIFLKVKRII